MPLSPDLERSVGGIEEAIVEAEEAEDWQEWRRLHLILGDLYEEADELEQASQQRIAAYGNRYPRDVRWPDARYLSSSLTLHQREILQRALFQPVAVLAGTPGTGKTFCAAALVHWLAEEHGMYSLAVAAPTGKAAVRISAAMASHDLPVRATTIHQLLEVGRSGHDGEGWAFRRGPTRYLDQKFVIIDESSMIDVELMASLLSACGPRAHVLLVGDPYQLPPVGHGAPLRDLIQSGVVGYGELTEIKRNSGMIVRSCREIRHGRPMESVSLPARSLPAQLPEGGVIHIPTKKGGELRNLLLLIEHLKQNIRPREVSGVIVWPWQVLCALNKSGSCSRHDINQALQQVLNPEPEKENDNEENNTEEDSTPGPKYRFRVGDPIICLRNQWTESPDVSERGQFIANGDIGYVLRVANDGTTNVEFDAPKRWVTIRQLPERNGTPRAPKAPRSSPSMEAESGDLYDLAYAVTVHKSQGSQWPIVITLADSSYGAASICSREWLYTAISRAEHCAITIGERGVLNGMLERQAVTIRKTFLQEKILGQ